MTEIRPDVLLKILHDAEVRAMDAEQRAQVLATRVAELEAEKGEVD